MPSVNKEYTPYQTFSVGIFEWLPKSSGKGGKKGVAKVRVSGDVSNSVNVFAMADKIKRELDSGTYQGNKNVTVKI